MKTKATEQSYHVQPWNLEEVQEEGEGEGRAAKIAQLLGISVHHGPDEVATTMLFSSRPLQQCEEVETPHDVLFSSSIKPRGIPNDSRPACRSPFFKDRNIDGTFNPPHSWPCPTTIIRGSTSIRSTNSSKNSLRICPFL
ncbi:hypothetical protein GOBAR_DD34332 [Gossypium barbadense]|nr:hypothetical protein GOBAR_DD34332 [Gossypium barbadense]